MGVSDRARLLFIGLWGEADDRGIFEWKPITIKMRLRAWDGEDVVKMLSELSDANMVKKFEAVGKNFGAVRKFCQWQRPKSPQYLHPCPSEIGDYVGFVTASEETSDRGTALGRILCERQNSRCHYCKESITFYRKKITSLEIEHRIPISRGGDDHISNLVGACKPCNSLKRNMTDDEFLAKFAVSDLARNRESQFAKRNSHDANSIVASAKVVQFPLSGEIPAQMEDGGGKGSSQSRNLPGKISEPREISVGDGEEGRR